MKLSKRALAVYKAASTDERRYAMTGVLVEPDGAMVATDGNILVKVTPAPGESVEEPVPTPVILPAKAAEAILKAIPRTPRYRTELGAELEVAQTNPPSSVAVVTIGQDTSTPQTLRFEKINGDYPNYRNVFPTEDFPVWAEYNVEVMLKLLNTIKACGVEVFKFELRDATSVARVTATRPDGEKVEGLIMPCRIK